MNKVLPMLLLAVIPAAGAFGSYAIDPTRGVFYFEDEDSARVNTGYEWYELDLGSHSAPVSQGRPLMSEGKNCTYHAKMKTSGVTVKGWGLGPGLNIADCNWWNYNNSTNCTFEYDSTYDKGGTAYLFLHLRYFRYGITFVSNMGAALPDMTDICYTNSVQLYAPTRTGYTFDGWTNGTFITAINGPKTASGLGVHDDGTNITLRAKWTVNEYTVLFDRNGEGDAVSPESKLVAYDSPYGDLPVPTWTGHAFGGWYTEPSGGSQVSVSTTVAITETQTLYARWTTNTYTVMFNASGGTTPTSSKTVTYGESYGDLPTPAWENHEFSGWFTAASGGEQVTASDTVSITDNQTLYAQWTANEYSVVFYNTDNTVCLSTNVTYGTKLTPPYIAVGANQYLAWWYDGSTRYGPNQQIEVTRAMELRPEIETSQATLTLACIPAAGGTTELVDGSLSGDAGRTVTVAAIPYDAYLFSGWSDGTHALTNTVSLSTNTTLTACFTKRSFTVAFLDWDGETSLGAVQTIEYGDAALAPADPERAGYTFTGWSADFGNVVSNMSVTAEYAANTYHVTYDANGGGGTMTNDVFTYDQEYTLQPNFYTRAMHDFMGWASAPDATTNEVAYADQAIVSNLTAVANGTNTLYAVWRSLLSDLSVAVECTNLVLMSSNDRQKWVVDPDVGFNSGSSARSVGSRISVMTADSAGKGTLTFWVKTVDPARLLFNDKPTGGISTDGKWMCFAYKVDVSDSFNWQCTMYDNENAECWVDQVHWYPGKSVTVQGNIDSTNKAEVTEAILSSWDAILGADAASVSEVVATGPAVTNAVALLNAGILPAVDTSVSPATLTFTEKELDVSISEFSVTDLPTATLKASISPHDTQPAVGLWGAPTLTSGWSQVESEGDFSRFEDEGIVAFEFNVSTNRFFKIIAQ